MRRTGLIIVITGLFLYSCGSVTEKERAEKEVKKEVLITAEERGFLDNLASLCGKSFAGEETYMEEGRESWADKNFVMHVTVCEEDKVHIPFHLDDDHSRTWMFLIDEEGLRFRHDHRYEDGTPEEKTLYGGYADGKGTEFRQMFPIDQYSIELLDDHEEMRQWNVVLTEDMSTLAYELLYFGEVVFRAEFDLTKPINVD